MKNANEPRCAFITGSTDGLGKALALELARKGWRVIVHGRSSDRCAKAVEEVARVASFPTEGHVADFCSLAEVARLAQVLGQDPAGLDVVVHNAALGLEPHAERTIDGIERVLQVNVVAPYVFTLAIADKLRKASGPRIIHVASSSQAELDFVDPFSEHLWDPLLAYARSKWALVTLSNALRRHSSLQGIDICAVHPATLMPTKLVLGKLPVQDSIEDGVNAVARLVTGSRPFESYFEGTAACRGLDSTYDRDFQERLMVLLGEVSGIPSHL